MNHTLRFFKETLESMGNALFHPFQDNTPPHIDPLPYRDEPYKKGLLHS